MLSFITRFLSYCFYLKIKIGGTVVNHSITLILQYILQYRKKVIEGNLERTKLTQSTLLKDIYYQLTCYITETIYGFYCPTNELLDRMKMPNLEVIESLTDQGKSVMVMSVHLGNWEWAGMALAARCKAEVVAVYKPLSNLTLDKILHEKRSRTGIKLAAMGEVIRYMRDTSKPRVYIFLSDQSPAIADNASVVDMLSVPTRMVVGPDKLCKRFGIVPVFQTINPLSAGYYEVHYEAMTNSEHMMQEYADLVTRDVRHYPSYWLWSHNRWKGM